MIHHTSKSNIDVGPGRKYSGIRGRLFIGFGIIISIIIIAITFMLYKITNIENSTSNIINNDLTTHDSLYDLTLHVYQAELSLMNWLITNDMDHKTLVSDSWNLVNNKLQNLDDHSEKWLKSSDQNKWQEIKSILLELKNAQTNVLNGSKENQIALADQVRPIFKKFLDVIDGPINNIGDRQGGLFDMQLMYVTKNENALIHDINDVRIMAYALLIISIVLSFLVAIYTARGITNYINKFRVHSSKIASGDLTQRINIVSHDELGELGHDLNSMTESLATITKQITEACHNMVTTIEEVKHAVDTQSAGATEQATSINQITASLEEIEKSSNQTIEKAKMLGDVAERTREKGQLGLNAVEESVQGMKAVRDKVQTIAQTILDLSNQTQQVGEITSVVNALAQQSKMLALNASIEAAKAGEAGKGFAVVATEVKNLAEQSEQSTTQVQKILEDIRRATEKAVMVTEEGTKGVDQGTELVEQTGDVVRSLSDVIHETTIASQQIEAAIRQEGVGIEQITAGMNEINQVTASFVDSVKQTTEAIAHIADMVQTLKQYMNIYKV